MWRPAPTVISFLLLWIQLTAAILNNKAAEVKRENVENSTRRDFTVYTDQEGKPFKFEEDSSKVRYEDYTSKNRNRNQLKGDKDALTSSSGHYDNGYGIYGPPEDQRFSSYQGYQAPTYVSKIPYGSDQEDHGFEHGLQPFSGHGFGHAPPPYHGHGGYPHHGGDGHSHHGGDHHNPLALKGLFLPLAGVALLGAAAALVSNPVLLQLGVITGRKRKRRSINKGEIEEDIFANNKFRQMNAKVRRRHQIN